MKLAAVMAHPDYVATRIGGTLLHHAAQGDDVSVLVLCPGDLGPETILYPDGSAGDIAAKQRAQLDDLAKVGGFNEISVRAYPDTQIANTPELRLDIAGWLRAVRPDILITHWPHDAHSDIRETGQAALDACLISVLSPIKTSDPAHKVAKAYTFPIRTSITFAPDTIVDITEVMPLKLRAIECLAMTVSELRAMSADPEGELAWQEAILAPDLHWGQQAGVRYGEPFFIHRHPDDRLAVRGLTL